MFIFFKTTTKFLSSRKINIKLNFLSHIIYKLEKNKKWIFNKKKNMYLTWTTSLILYIFSLIDIGNFVIDNYNYLYFIIVLWF